MSEIVRQVGFSLVQDSSRFSDRVCNPCGRKIRNLGQLYHFVKNATTTKSTPVKTSKRNLDTPDKASPPWGKSKSERVRSPIDRTPLREVPPLMRSKKSLAFENAVNTSSALLVQESKMLSHMNVEDLPNDGLKIVFMYPSGNVTVRIPRDSRTKTLVKNVATKQRREVINALLMHEEIKPELYQEISLYNYMSLEFDEYLKSGCILEARNPDELASISNKIFMKEVRIFCPLWFDCVRGASGLSQNAFKECVPEINSLALATPMLARLRNAKASAVHNRISTIMFHSGVKHDDLTRLNHLGVCMSPD